MSVSIVLPVCGIENYIEDTLRSAFRLDYPRYELIFCASRPDDPAVPLVQRLMADHPWIDARLLTGNERISDNPKLNNVFKGWRETAYPFVAICDSNVLLPRDYIQRLLSKFDPQTGLVCSPPIGCWPDGFFAEVECAMLNNYQARWQCFADAVGFGFAQGKTLFWRKSDLERAGGIRALAAESAEDAACTKIVRNLGLRVQLMEPPVRQPLGFRRAVDVWKRQRRWARLRRASFPLYFSVEIFSGSLRPARSADRGGTSRRNAGLRAGAGLSGGLVWRRMAVVCESRLAQVALVDRHLHAARPDAAGRVRECLARPRLRMARQRHARSRRRPAVLGRPRYSSCHAPRKRGIQ